MSEMFKPVAIAAFVVWLNWGFWRDDVMGFWFNLFFGALVGTFGLGLTLAALIGAAFGISRVIGDQADAVWHQSWHAQLATLRNADGVHGTISGGVFLLAGSVDSAEVYYYYTQEGPNTYKPRKWRPDGDTFVIEEDRADAEVFQFETQFKRPLLEWFGLPNDRRLMEFHIPKGSLVHQYQLK